MKEKFIDLYDKSIWGLYGYFIALVILIGFFMKNDVVSQMMAFSFFYGIVLVAYFILFTVVMFISLKNKPINSKQLVWILLKLLIALSPMFFLDNRFAKLFSIFA